LCRTPDGGEHDHRHDEDLTPENFGCGQERPRSQRDDPY
jgi:hypothetical protein